MKTLLLTIGLWVVVVTKSLCCVCSPKLDFQSQKDLLEYDFISLVKILKIDTVSNYKEYSKHPIHKINFEILEHFKGEITNSIFVYGGHWSLKINGTSCDLWERPNEEWIIFAYTDKTSSKLMTGLCTRSSMQREVDGYQDKGYGDDLTIVEKLRKILDRPIEVPYSGKRMEYYSNGQKELEEFYRKGRLEGQSFLWYPEGVLESKQSFKKGLRHGTAEWYSRKGQLIGKRTFLKGHLVDTTTYWHEEDTSKVHIRHVYDRRGRIMHTAEFNIDGVMIDERVYDPKENKQVVRSFHSNGVLSSEMYQVNNVEFGMYREWDENGRLSKSWEYDKEGRVIEGSFKEYKD